MTELITVTGNGTYRLTLYKKVNGLFEKKLSTPCYIGKNGMTKNKTEGDMATPIGIFNINLAFGILDNPGTALKYIKITPNTYLIDDTHSKYYGKIVEKNKITPDCVGGEHMIEYEKEYRCGAVIEYNKNCVPGLGSGIFLHCADNNYTHGCISVKENIMIEILKELHPGAVIWIKSGQTEV